MASSPSSHTLVFLQLPAKTFVGIDLLSFNSSPNFHGITNVATGLHFIFTGTDASLAVRHGQWLKCYGETETTHVFKWSTELESLLLLSKDDPVTQNARSGLVTGQSAGFIDYGNLQDATSNIQPPTTASPKDWPILASQITSNTIKRIVPSQTLTSISSSQLDTETIPGLTALEASSALSAHDSLNLLSINLKQTWPDTALGRDRTNMARDRSWYLRHLMDSLSPSDRAVGAKEILGELQFCFLMVLTLMNWSCLEGWKRVLSVVFTCQTAIGEVEDWFVEVLKVLQMQLAHVDDVEGGLFDLRDEVGSAWLRRLVNGFRGSVEEVCGEQSGLKKQMGTFEEWLRETFGWEIGRDVVRRGMLELEDGERVEVSLEGADEEEERGEFAPVIVET